MTIRVGILVQLFGKPKAANLHQESFFYVPILDSCTTTKVSRNNLEEMEEKEFLICEIKMKTPIWLSIAVNM